MTTNLPKAELVDMGREVRADYLAEQAGYTLGIAALEGEDLSDLLPESFLAETGAALDAVNVSRRDKTLLAEEAKDATSAQGDASKAAKVWRRRVVGRSKRAARLGNSVPDALLRVGRPPTRAAFVGQIKEMSELFDKNVAVMPGKDSGLLAEEGKRLVATLTVADTDKNVKYERELPAAVREFYEQKGLLYIALKIINDAGHELFADDAVSAGRFNLHILYRRGTRKKAEPAPSA